MKPKIHNFSESPCLTNNGGCSDDCIDRGDGIAVCVCPCGKTLDFDKKTCVQTNVCPFDVSFWMDGTSNACDSFSFQTKPRSVITTILNIKAALHLLTFKQRRKCALEIFLPIVKNWGSSFFRFLRTDHCPKLDAKTSSFIKFGRVAGLKIPTPPLFLKWQLSIFNSNSDLKNILIL